MIPLTDKEIKFVKETHFTPTVYQCDQYYLTTYTDEKCEYDPEESYIERKEEYSKKWYSLIKNDAKEHYGVDLDEFLKKSLNDEDADSITLEYTATYLFCCFFTKQELEALSDEEATKFLQDYKYYGGFRKWDSDNLKYVNEAIEIFDGKRELYFEDGNIANREVEERTDDYYLAGHGWWDICYCCAKCKADCGRKDIPEGICTVTDFSRKCKSYKEDKTIER